MSRPSFRAMSAPAVLSALFGSAARVLRVSPTMAVVVLSASAMMSCAASAQSSAAVVGQALDANGQPLQHAVVHLISDPTAHNGNTWRYTLVGDALGKFSQEGLAPGAYLVMLSTDGQASDVLQSIRLHDGAVEHVQLRAGQWTAERAMTPVASGTWTAVRR